jgi:hypothetical protein
MDFFINPKIFIYMILDVDILITLFEKYSQNKQDGEIGEQDAAAAAPSGGSTGGGKAPPKWSDVHGGPKRGKANMLGKGGEKWETGMNRGVANQIW